MTALYVHIDDRLKTSQWRGRPPRPTDAELITLAVAQAVPGFHCEARRLRFAHAHLHGMFPYLPQQPACNKRLRAALGLVEQAIRSLAADTDLWLDDMWIVDSTPVECARSRETVRRSDLAGRADYDYDYCRSHSHFHWGLKPHRVCTPAGLPTTWALADKGYIAAGLGRFPAGHSISLLRPSYRNRGTPRPGEALLKTVRQLIESVNDTLKGQLDLEQHGGRTTEGVGVRVAQRILAMTWAIWHNRAIGAPITRSLTAYDH